MAVDSNAGSGVAGTTGSSVRGEGGDKETEAGAGTPALSVVLPAHNEADNLEPLIREIIAALDGVIDYEIVVTDDGSADATPRVLETMARETRRLRVLRHRKQSGQSAAMMTGFRAARAPWIATLDSDMQNDPADIPKLLAVLDKPDTPADLSLVAGHRVNRRDTWLKRISSRIANRTRGALLKDNTPDTGCGLKLIKRDAIIKVPFFDHFHRFLPALVLRDGGRIVSVPVNHRPREKGRSHYGLHNRLWVGIVDMLGVIWLQRRARAPVADELDYRKE